MEGLFITDFTIDKVRHLEKIEIPLDREKRKHLILTGRNGSGKTSVLDKAAEYFRVMFRQGGAAFSMTFPMVMPAEISLDAEAVRDIGITLKFSRSLDELYHMFCEGKFVLAYYKADRSFEVEDSAHVEKVELKSRYLINDSPRVHFVKYLRDLKMTQALAAAGGKREKSEEISRWFEKLRDLLRSIFEDDSLELLFDEETFQFSIVERGREPFGFNTLSSGYAAVLDIVADLMLRMEKQTKRTFDFHMSGIVLVDEIDAHLHLEMQRNIMKLLTTVFPNIQFIVSTHSPFILNSLKDAVIYDLENHLLVGEGLTDIPYDGIVDGYFRADTMSESLKEKFNRYRILVNKGRLSDEDMEEIAGLELFLEEIPDYLALGITTEYRKLKLDFENREDV